MGVLLEWTPPQAQVSMLEMGLPLYLEVSGIDAPRPVVPLVGQGLQSLCGSTPFKLQERQFFVMLS